jgi:hypothetical protein
MTTIVVPGKSPQYATIKGFSWCPWSWIVSVSLLLFLSSYMEMDLRVLLATLITTMCLEVVPSSVSKARALHTISIERTKIRYITLLGKTSSVAYKIYLAVASRGVQQYATATETPVAYRFICHC